jgi:serine/threonine-protein kinase
VRSSQPFDQVVDQDPNAGEEAESGATVTLEVSDGPGEVLVPGVEGLPQAQAIDDLEDAGLRVNVDRKFSDELRKGLALRTVPREGAEVTRGTRVRLLVSQGPEQVTVPEVVGLSRESAESRLRDEGLGVAVQEQESEEPVGEVVAQDLAGGTRVERGTTVTITVSTGTQKVDVPNVVGLESRDAISQIGAAGLSPVERERTVTDPAQDGVVIDQRPGAGIELDEGGQVVIIVGVLEEQDVLEPEEPEVPVDPEAP